MKRCQHHGRRHSPLSSQRMFARKNLRINTFDLPHEHSCQSLTSVWAKWLSKSLEQQSILEGLQEGLQPDRSTRRQISCFISALQDVERNQSIICVTFLDFQNYVNTISLPGLFLLLRKFGMNKNNVQALECKYEHSHMRVIHTDSVAQNLPS